MLQFRYPDLIEGFAFYFIAFNIFWHTSFWKSLSIRKKTRKNGSPTKETYGRIFKIIKWLFYLVEGANKNGIGQLDIPYELKWNPEKFSDYFGINAT